MEIKRQKGCSSETPRPLGAQHPTCRRGSRGWRRLLSLDFIMNVPITHRRGISILLTSVAGRLSCGVQHRVSTPLSVGTGGKRVGFGLPRERRALAGLGVVGSHSGRPLSVGQSPAVPSTASQSVPALSNCFMRSHHNPQVNSDFLFIRFSWKTKQLIKKKQNTRPKCYLCP